MMTDKQGCRELALPVGTSKVAVTVPYHHYTEWRLVSGTINIRVEFLLTIV